MCVICKRITCNGCGSSSGFAGSTGLCSTSGSVGLPGHFGIVTPSTTYTLKCHDCDDIFEMSYTDTQNKGVIIQPSGIFKKFKTEKHLCLSCNRNRKLCKII